MVGKAADVLVRIKGDHKNLDSAVDKSKSKIGGLKSAAVAAGPAIAAAGAVAAAGFVVMAVKMAAEEQAVAATTAALLKKQGIMWEDVGGETDKYLKKLEKLTTFNDTDLQLSFNAILATGVDYNAAMKSMTTATGLAAGTGMDLATAGKMVGRALQDDITVLKRYGIEAENGADAMRIMNERFGDGSHQAGTLEGQMRDLKNQLSNVAEAIGVELLPVFSAMVAGTTEFVESGMISQLNSMLEIVGRTAYGTALTFRAMGEGLMALFSATVIADPDATVKWLDKMGNTVLTLGDNIFDMSDEIVKIWDEVEDGSRGTGVLAAANDAYNRSLDMTANSRNTNTAAIDGETGAIIAQNAELDRQISKYSALDRAYMASRGGTGRVSGGGEYARFAPSAGKTYGSQADVSAARERGEIKTGDVYTVTPTINIGTVNESSAGNVAVAINKEITKSVNLSAW